MPVPMPSFAAILPAAGASSRYGGPRNKLLEMLGGRTVLDRSVEAFGSRADVALIVLPTRGPIGIGSDERIKVCQGGATRAESALTALREVPAETGWVAVHD